MRTIVACCVLWLASAAAVQARVVALVVGSDYAGSTASGIKLPNTLIDAKSVAAMFERIGVDSVRLVENPDGDHWIAAVEEIAAVLTEDDVALLYYAGHAVQVDGENFLVAGDGDVLVSAEQVLSALMRRARGVLFTVDACRNNPFRDSSSAFDRVVRVRDIADADSRGFQPVELAGPEIATGLSQMNNVRGRNAVVLFSTEPGNVAIDGEPGAGSPFANAFVRELARRQSLDAAIRRITAEVSDKTRGAQSPWRQGDLAFPLFLAGQPRFPVP